ncbi:MAG: penicillin-binding protein 2 [Bacilli bacterium]|nr:penicillin-binding protein 2 [Bacilli bacterium]
MRKKTFYVCISIVILFFVVVIMRIGYLAFFKGNFYQTKLKEKTEIYLEGLSSPRGRILDVNGKVIVDNIGIKQVVYNKLSGINTQEEIEIAYKLANMLTINYEENVYETKKFWLINNKDTAKSLITEEEYRLLEERKITMDEINSLKYERVTDKLLEVYSVIDRKAAHIYALMNKGYSYEKKIITTEVSDFEYAKIMEAKIKGITGEMSWERTYPYGDSLKTILGSVGGVPAEEKTYYLNNGYSLNDIVGISYLEKEYEEYLRGEKALYKVNKDNTLTIIKEAKKGNDLILSIDIEIQMKVEEILKEKILIAKSEANTEYYKESYAVISEPDTGAIKAMAGIRLIGDKQNPSWQDVSTNIINTSYTPGSVVKAASMTVGYKENVIEKGKKIKDGCVKLYLVPEKCSYKKLGYLDDIGALRNSSNYYQFMIAINLVGQKYKSNMELKVSEEHFKIYRDVFASFGLGVKTGIDLPNEQVGITGKKVAADLLLNLAIGQYDTYTPIELVQYINTVANNGIKKRPTLMHKVVNNFNKPILENKYPELSKVDIKEENILRIKQGLHEVLTLGTGRGHIDVKYNPAGKTGTSESFYDSNSDGKADVATISSLFVGFAPVDDPKYSIVVISPNVSHNNTNFEYKSKVNRHISKSITDFLFENY